MTNINIYVIFALFIVSVFYIRHSYHIGFKKAFRIFLSIAIPIVLAGTSVRIGRIFLTDSMNVTYYIACIGTVLFYLVLYPILLKEESDRYRRITRDSRILGALISAATIWMFCSYLMFFVRLALPGVFSSLNQHFTALILMPVNIIWLFPYHY